MIERFHHQKPESEVGAALGISMHVTNNIMRHALLCDSDFDLDSPARSGSEEKKKRKKKKEH